MQHFVCIRPHNLLLLLVPLLLTRSVCVVPSRVRSSYGVCRRRRLPDAAHASDSRPRASCVVIPHLVGLQLRGGVLCVGYVVLPTTLPAAMPCLVVTFLRLCPRAGRVLRMPCVHCKSCILSVVTRVVLLCVQASCTGRCTRSPLRQSQMTTRALRARPRQMVPLLRIRHRRAGLLLPRRAQTKRRRSETLGGVFFDWSK